MRTSAQTRRKTAYSPAVVQTPQEPEVSETDVDAGNETEYDAPPTTTPAHVMEAISDMLDQKHLRIADLFRHPMFNPAYNKTGVDDLSPTEIAEVFGKAGLSLSASEMKTVVDCIDDDNNGRINISELEDLVRAHRRGNFDWDALLSSRVARQKKARAPDLQRLHGLSDLHRSKLDKLKQKRQQQEEEEMHSIEEAKAANRLGTRAQLTDADYDKDSCWERLHGAHRELADRRRQRAAEYEAQDQRRIEETSVRWQTRSSPDLRNVADPEGSSNGSFSFKHVGERLHARSRAKAEREAKLRQEAEAAMVVHMDTISRAACAGGGSPRHHALFDDAQNRRARLEKHAERCKKLAEEQIQKNTVGAGRKKLTIEEIKIGRINALHDEAAPREARRQELMKSHVAREIKTIQDAAKSARFKPAKEFECVRSKYKDFSSTQGSSPGMMSPKSPGSSGPLGFGCKMQRDCLDREEEGNKWTMTTADHCLATINMAVALRCNCQPTEEQLHILRDALDPLELAMQEFRDANRESELNSDGHMYLKRTDSRRLFAEGNLLEDGAGFRNCCEPDPLHQLIEDAGELMEVAQRAQNNLLAMVGPEQQFDAQQIQRRWPKGAKWNHPTATRKAQFAYNPGPKTWEKAQAKSFVRYGPSQGSNRFRHLTDLARCSLVFADAHMLRAGLEQIVSRFEVVDVRNYYHANNTSLLGYKRVEVLVVVKCPEPFMCEIRLEEMGFFIAQERAQPHIDAVAQSLVSLYSVAGAKPEAISYLVEWTLHRPKEIHALTVFRKHLARRYGSTIAAWRRALGNGQLAPFLKFREVCQEIGQRSRTVEYWQGLDATRAGCLSIFEFDPEAVVLLVKFYWRVLGAVRQEQFTDADQLFAMLTSKTVVKLNRANQIEAHEFRRLTKPLGLSGPDSDRIFACLDSRGGEAMIPPATLTPQDFMWLMKFGRMVDIASVMLQNDSSDTTGGGLKAISSTGGRSLRIPASVSVGLNSRPSMFSPRCSSLSVSHTALCRRSVSSSPTRNSKSSAGFQGRASILSCRSINSRQLTARESFLQTIKLQQLPEEAPASPNPAAAWVDERKTADLIVKPALKAMSECVAPGEEKQAKSFDAKEEKAIDGAWAGMSESDMKIKDAFDETALPVEGFADLAGEGSDFDGGLDLLDSF